MTTTADAPAARLGRRVLVGGFAAVALLGGSQALYGPAVPAFRRAFDAGLASAGLGLPVHAAASFVGVAVWGLLERRGRPAGPVLAAGASAFGLGALGVAAAPSLVTALGAVVVLGLGFGLVMTGVNTLVARDPRPTVAGLINALHAMFGLGAVALPVILSLGGFRTAFAVLAIGGGVVLLPLWTARDPAPVVTVADPSGAAPDRRGIVLWFAALYVAYLGVEAGIANWMATHLAALEWSEDAAARWTAAFWLAFTIGRFAVAPFAARTPPRRLVRLSLVLGAGALLVAHLDAAAPWAFVVAGLVLAPVFPTGLVWLARTAPEVRSGTTYMLLAGSLGAAALPAFVGLVAARLGVEVVPTALLAFAIAAALVAATIARRADGSADGSGRRWGSRVR